MSEGAKLQWVSLKTKTKKQNLGYKKAPMTELTKFFKKI
jgi:hypothetical protein